MPGTAFQRLVFAVLLAISLGVAHWQGIGVNKRADTAKTISMLAGVLDTYRLDTGAYPTMKEGLQALVKNVNNSSGWHGPYPENGLLPNDPWGHPYQYKVPSDHNKDFDVFSMGQDGVAGTPDDIGNWDPNLNGYVRVPF